MNKGEFVSALNEWGSKRRPFFFMIDFEMRKPLAIPMESVDSSQICFAINGLTNRTLSGETEPAILDKNAIPFSRYEAKFDIVFQRLCYGDSYLANLTSKTRVTLSHSLIDVYRAASARYKLYFRDEFVVFSPECFIRIENGYIFSFPMKGTINAAIPDARKIILEDAKELAEHVTIVDLIRNDLSVVSDDVTVTRFRYVEELRTMDRNLLQVSSEIRGSLPGNFNQQLGNLIVSLLPAGSISGAPKEKTVQIIREAEGEERGYYTGVFGYFDGRRLDSGVMIRFIEKKDDEFYYRSGGGITTQSSAKKEYQEIIDKVYVPVA
jgi:para-aminobenzoate synthetase component I